jgi:hypothetical protein
VGLLLAWVVLMLAALVGTTMVAVGMIEELPGIVRNALSRSLIIQRAPLLSPKGAALESGLKARTVAEPGHVTQELHSLADAVELLCARDRLGIHFFGG